MVSAVVGAVFSLVLAVIFLGVVPVLTGNTLCGIMKIDLNLGKSYVTGYIGIWALFQIIAVPLVLLKQSFLIVVIVLSIIILGLCAYGIVKKFRPKLVPSMKKVEAKIAFLVMCLAVIALLIATMLLQHTDADDSRFVVNAVDIVRTNRMFLTNPATGKELDIWEGELLKDITSPWAVFIAYCGKIAGIHATIMAHTVLPVVLTLMLCIVYWMLSDVFFPGDTVYRSIFTCIVILLNVYGYYSVYSAETFAITRIWQGKAVVASIGIPLVFLICMKIYEDEKRSGYYGILYLMSFAMCLMSGMGIIIMAIMVGCIGSLYGIMKKSLRIFLKILLAAVPCVIYYGLYFLEKGFI